jgi:hypothetical protein
VICCLPQLMACRYPISHVTQEKLNGSTFVGDVNRYNNNKNKANTHYQQKTTMRDNFI